MTNVRGESADGGFRERGLPFTGVSRIRTACSVCLYSGKVIVAEHNLVFSDHDDLKPVYCFAGNCFVTSATGNKSAASRET